MRILIEKTIALLWAITPEYGTNKLPETSVRNYHYSLRNKPEERSSQLLRGGSLKLRILNELWSLVRVLSLLLFDRSCGPKVNGM